VRAQRSFNKEGVEKETKGGASSKFLKKKGEVEAYKVERSKLLWKGSS